MYGHNALGAVEYGGLLEEGIVPSASLSPSSSASASQSPSASLSPSSSASASQSPSASLSPSSSASTSLSPSASPSFASGWNTYPLYLWDGGAWLPVDITGI